MTVAGIWVNEYGSRMTLASRGDGIFGLYESTTGSVGKYLVTGWQLDAELRTSAMNWKTTFNPADCPISTTFGC